MAWYKPVNWNIYSFSIAALLAVTCSSAAAKVPRFIDAQTLKCMRALQAPQAKQETIILADPVSTGKYYARELRKLGYRVVSLLSKEENAGLASTYQRGDFDGEIREGDDFASLMEQIRSFEPVRLVLPASEGGVSLSLKLSNLLKLEPTNPDTPIYRDKFEMGKHWDESPQIAAVTIEEAREFIHRHGLWQSGGAFIKPLLASGSVLGRHVRNDSELETGFAKILQNTDNYGHRNSSVLIQPYLEGPEYGINAVVLGDHVVFTSMIHYDKVPVEGAGDLYRSDRFLPFEGELQSKFQAYFKRLVKKFGIRVGPVHAEVKVTPSGEIKLVEIAVRQCGGGKAVWEKYATGRSQIDLTIEAYLFPELFLQRPSGFELDRQVMMVSVHTEGGNLMKSYAEIDEILKGVSGYYDRSFFQTENQVLKRSVDMETFVVRVVLTSAKTRGHLLDKGIAELLKLEKSKALEIPQGW